MNNCEPEPPLSFFLSLASHFHLREIRQDAAIAFERFGNNATRLLGDCPGLLYDPAEVTAEVAAAKKDRRNSVNAAASSAGGAASPVAAVGVGGSVSAGLGGKGSSRSGASFLKQPTGLGGVHRKVGPKREDAEMSACRAIRSAAPFTTTTRITVTVRD